MVRGIAAVVTTIVVTGIVLLAFAPVVEDIGETVKTYDSIDEGSLEGTQTINKTYDALFIYIPLILIGGSVLGAAVFYYRRETARRIR